MEEIKKDEINLSIEKKINRKWLLINIFIAFCSTVILGERFIIGYHAPHKKYYE